MEASLSKHMYDKSWKEAMACLQSSAAPDELSQGIVKHMISMEKQKDKLNTLSPEKETQKPSAKRKVEEMRPQELDEVAVLHESKKMCAANDKSLKREIIFVDCSEDELPEPKKLILDYSKVSSSEVLLPKKDTNVNKDMNDSQDKHGIHDKEDSPQDDPNDIDKRSNEKVREELLTEEEMLQFEDVETLQPEAVETLQPEAIETEIDSPKTKSIWLVRTMRKLEGYPELQQGLSSLLSDFPESEFRLCWLAKLSREDTIENVSKLLRNHPSRPQKSESENSAANNNIESDNATLTHNIAKIVEYQEKPSGFKKISSENDNTDEKHLKKEKAKPKCPFQLIQVSEPLPTPKDHGLDTGSSCSDDVEFLEDLYSVNEIDLEEMIVPFKRVKETSPFQLKPIDPFVIPNHLKELSGFPEIQQGISSIIQELPRENAVLDESVSMELLQKLKKLQVINEQVSALLGSPHQPEERPVINLYVVQRESNKNQPASEMKGDLSTTRRGSSVIRWVLSSISSYLLILMLHFGICAVLKEYLK